MSRLMLVRLITHIHAPRADVEYTARDVEHVGYRPRSRSSCRALSGVDALRRVELLETRARVSRAIRTSSGMRLAATSTASAGPWSEAAADAPCGLTTAGATRMSTTCAGAGGVIA